MVEPAGTHDIEIRIPALVHLFNSLDPSPFLQRDLDGEAEAHIVGWARELPGRAAIRIVISLPEEEAMRARREGVGPALQNYFALRAEAVRRDLKELFRQGWVYLAIGLPVLAVCLISSQLVERAIGPGPVTRIMEESLIIVGWVANWRPIETFLYDWWPLVRRMRLYRRLEAAEVKIVAV